MFAFVVSAFIAWSQNKQNDDIFMNFGVSVHIFHQRNRFSRFWSFEKNEMFSCGNDLIEIKNWKWINIHLQDEWKLILSKIVYIVLFLINLIFLARLQNRGIKWDHVTKKIFCLKTVKILNHIIRQNKNYRISEIFQQNHHYVFSSVFVFIKTVDSTASANIWHRRMGHLNPLDLHHLGKQCLGVRLKNPSMSQCDVCAKVKMTNQVFHHSLINQSTRSFYKVNIDWKDLDEGWNNYQFDETIVKWVMKIVCQITNMVITYFILIRKKDENLLFI